MATDDDPEILAYKDALARHGDCVVFKSQAQVFIREELGSTQRHFCEEMLDYVQHHPDGIDKQVEKRDPWYKYYEFRYDLRFPFNGGPDVYVESRLVTKRDPYYNTIIIVKVKYRDEKLNRECKVQT